MVKLARDWKTKAVTVHSEDWEPNETVTLKAYFSDFDRQRVLSSAVEQVRNPDTGAVTTRATIHLMEQTKRKLAIVSWTLTYEDGTPIPCTAETIDALPSEVCVFLDAEIDKLWDGLGNPISKEEADRQTAEEKEKN